jgi:hypothetical protein
MQGSDDALIPAFSLKNKILLTKKSLYFSKVGITYHGATQQSGLCFFRLVSHHVARKSLKPLNFTCTGKLKTLLCT